MSGQEKEKSLHLSSFFTDRPALSGLQSFVSRQIVSQFFSQIISLGFRLYIYSKSASQLLLNRGNITASLVL